MSDERHTNGDFLMTTNDQGQTLLLTYYDGSWLYVALIEDERVIYPILYLKGRNFCQEQRFVHAQDPAVTAQRIIDCLRYDQADFEQFLDRHTEHLFGHRIGNPRMN